MNHDIWYIYSFTSTREEGRITGKDGLMHNELLEFSEDIDEIRVGEFYVEFEMAIFDWIYVTHRVKIEGKIKLLINES